MASSGTSSRTPSTSGSASARAVSADESGRGRTGSTRASSAKRPRHWPSSSWCAASPPGRRGSSSATRRGAARARSRRMCCEVFAANGIRSYLFDGVRSTPEISFAVRHLRTTAGVQITASHNPRTDNGFKFYWTYGGQVVPPLDAEFMQLVRGVSSISRVDFERAQADGLIQTVGKDVDTRVSGGRQSAVDRAESVSAHRLQRDAWRGQHQRPARPGVRGIHRRGGQGAARARRAFSHGGRGFDQPRVPRGHAAAHRAGERAKRRPCYLL